MLDVGILEGLQGVKVDSVYLDFNSQGQLDGNMSSIYSILIRAAYACEHYASDLLYDLDAIRGFIEGCHNDEVMEDKAFYLGFRKCGVDGITYITHRCDCADDLSRFYKSVYRLRFVVSHSDCPAWFAAEAILEKLV